MSQGRFFNTPRLALFGVKVRRAGSSVNVLGGGRKSAGKVGASPLTIWFSMRAAACMRSVSVN
ncbi:Uncharacterised protein [Mycobacterium tuberculosis]|nr:Uncharacterised protein [Mycobacterium tuberculosis]